MGDVMAIKKKKVNEGLRGIAQTLTREQEIEKNLKLEISRELHEPKRPKK